MEILQITSSFLRNAASCGLDSYAYGIADKAATQRSESLVPEVMRLTEKNSGFRILHITDIQLENVAVVKKLIYAGFEVRHLEGNKIRFSISKEEYIETSHIAQSRRSPRPNSVEQRPATSVASNPHF